MPNKKTVLMLSDQARSDANPILLIDENDVFAGHGSIGQVDPEDMYYLMSRGLDQATEPSGSWFPWISDRGIPVQVREEMIKPWR